MNALSSQARLVAGLQTACVCATIEGAIILALGTFMNSWLGAAGVSFLLLGPLSLWIAPAVYRRLLRAGR
ncbi:MAG TPA: hypothetical protein VIL30_25015 [Ramlibacter sp.]|jgi:membrane protein YdbS with pleckstrin-like domain